MCSRLLANTIVCSLRASSSLRHAGGFIDIAAPNAKIAIHHRRVVENEKLFPGWRAILLDNLHFSSR